MSEKKLGPTEFQAEIERLQAEGKMPSLDELLDTVAEVRAEYVPRILEVRRGKVAAA